MSSLELQELEPSPVEETPPLSTTDNYFPPQPTKRTSFLGLNGGKHSVLYYVHRAQRYSSYTFTAFLAAHITNTSLLPLYQSIGSSSANEVVTESSRYLLLTRPYYQSWPIAEPLLIIAPLAVHVLSGLGLRFYHRRRAVRLAGAETRAERHTIRWPALSGTSLLGMISVPLLLAHVYTTRILPLRAEGGSSSITLEYVSHGFALFPATSFVAYLALVSVVGTHVVWGWARWLRLAPSQVVQPGVEGALAKKRRWYAITGVSVATVLVWLAGGLGVVGRGGKTAGWVGKLYDQMYRLLPILGSRI